MILVVPFGFFKYHKDINFLFSKMCLKFVEK